MLVKNYRQLARNRLRRQALKIIDAGLQAIGVENILGQKIRQRDHYLEIDRHKIDLDRFRRVFVVGFGKASLDSARFLEKLLADRVSGGIVIDVRQGRLKKIKSVKGSHPYPNLINIRATEEMVAILKQCRKNDLVIVIVSGGGSALLSKPHRLTPEQLTAVIKDLFKKGADIRELNILRKHLSEIHGGWISRLAWPAQVVGLIFSDIPFSDLSLVASGPTFFDKSTKKDARAIIKKYELPALPLLETPKEQKYFSATRNILMLSNKTALEAMACIGKKLGLAVHTCRTRLTGEARVIGRQIVQEYGRKKGLFLFGGETTVKVKGSGRGGRNQELVLSAIPYLRSGQLIASVASDGKDNIWGVAGALADMLTVKMSRQKNLSPELFLEDNNSYEFFKKTGDVIITGITGSNVSDLILFMNDKK